MAISNRWINDVFLCLLLPLFVSASDRTADNHICYDDSDIRKSQYLTYHGCYNLSCFVPETNSNVNDIDQCTDKCKSGSHSYASLFNGSRCSCGKFLCGRADMVCDFKCGLPCNASPVDFQTCGGKKYSQVYEKTFRSKSDLATISTVVVLVIFGIIVAGIIKVRWQCILQVVRNREQAASPGPSSHAVNQLEDGDYVELRPVGSRNRATSDPFLDLKIKPERSGSDEYHEYADVNYPTRSASALRIGRDGYLVPESFS
ncbi:uncharacterized protein LOC115923340 [Strongylocentrotus purpuratus]|uniref:WSC domain-containing protein n=1 Tax=Strongylocentrotus purpuratus TaxID=7668 RepID=A0A7M7NPN8_STRPU|nr:uncharacterized protein LOC115923340 [Strongylocentrotus purpuratus]